MELEVGMYVRIKNKAGWCCIGKLYNINDFREPSMKYCIDIQSDDFIFVPKDMIIKASNNIIDLIEVGDIVEVEFANDNGTNKFEVVGVAVETNEVGIFKDDYSIYGVDIKDIKSIVTKEQFSAMEYRLGDK